MKQLTDEQIKTVCKTGGWDDSWQSVQFARAIEAEVLRLNGWQPIGTAPENMDRPVAVLWIDSEGQERQDFDYKEDGCWMVWHDHAEHTKIIGGHGVSYTPPYKHWMALPATLGNHIGDANKMVAPYSGADENPPVFGRRWSLARDGFGLQRDENGNYVHIDDALSVLHASRATGCPETMDDMGHFAEVDMPAFLRKQAG